MRKRRWSRLWKATDGLGAVELGFIAPVLLLLVLGIIDFGMAYWQQMEIANAANTGTQFAIAKQTDLTTTAGREQVKTIARSATNLSTVVVTPDPAVFCGCPTSSGVTSGFGTYPSCTACPDGAVAKGYVIVNTRICYPTLFTWPGLAYCTTSNSSCNGCGTNEIVLTAQSIVLK